jgi:indole-3-glycerol phosphate synthase
MSTILDTIVQDKKKELAEAKQKTPLETLKSRITDLPQVRDFAGALTAAHPSSVRIIAEVKKASPSKGILCQQFDPVAIARAYGDGGAAAVSVLTEKNYFQGSLAYLRAIKDAIALPVLRKDFIFDPYQLYESRAYGADAVLLIAGMLSEELLAELLQLSRALSLCHLVEVHDRTDLQKALAAGAEIIGINNRDLKTFVTDIRTTIDLMPAIPEDKIVVSESGISSRQDLQQLADAGVDAFLIGETLMKEKNPGIKLRELIGQENAYHG